MDDKLSRHDEMLEGLTTSCRELNETQADIQGTLELILNRLTTLERRYASVPDLNYDETGWCVRSIHCGCDICIRNEGLNCDEMVCCVRSLDCECDACIESVCFNSHSSLTGRDNCALVEDKVFDEISQRDEPALSCNYASYEVSVVPLVGHDHHTPSGIKPVIFAESLFVDSEELSDATALTSRMKSDLETEQVGEAQVFAKSPHRNNDQQVSQFAPMVMDPFASLVLGGACTYFYYASESSTWTSTFCSCVDSWFDTGQNSERKLRDYLVKSKEPTYEDQYSFSVVDCSSKGYHSRKHEGFDLCLQCFQNGKFDLETGCLDFILIESVEVSEDMFLNALPVKNQSDTNVIVETYLVEFFMDDEHRDGGCKLFNKLTERYANLPVIGSNKHITGFETIEGLDHSNPVMKDIEQLYKRHALTAFGFYLEDWSMNLQLYTYAFSKFVVYLNFLDLPFDPSIHNDHIIDGISISMFKNSISSYEIVATLWGKQVPDLVIKDGGIAESQKFVKRMMDALCGASEICLPALILLHNLFHFQFDPGSNVCTSTSSNLLLGVCCENKEMSYVVKFFEIPHQITVVLDQVSGYTKVRAALLNTATLNFGPGICSGHVQALSLIFEKHDFSLDDPQAQKMNLTTGVALDPSVNWRKRACFPSLHYRGTNMVLSVANIILLHSKFGGLTEDIAPVTAVVTQEWTGVSLSAYVDGWTELASRKGLKHLPRFIKSSLGKKTTEDYKPSICLLFAAKKQGLGFNEPSPMVYLLHFEKDKLISVLTDHVGIKNDLAAGDSWFSYQKFEVQQVREHELQGQTRSICWYFLLVSDKESAILYVEGSCVRSTSNKESLQFPYDPGGSLPLVKSKFFSGNNFDPLKIATFSLSFYKELDLPTSEDSHLQKAPPRLQVNGYMVPKEQRLHIKEATYGSQIAGDISVPFSGLSHQFPFDPGGFQISKFSYFLDHP